MNVLNIQQRIAKVAEERPEACFTALNHYMDIDWMKEACRRLRKASAPGVDGQSVASYGENLESNLLDLIDRIKSGRYVAPPVRRVHIPKGDGRETRPIGVPTVEDKGCDRQIMYVTRLLELGWCARARPSVLRRCGPARAAGGCGQPS